MTTVDQMMAYLHSLAEQDRTEGISVVVATDDDAIARRVAPMLARALHPWLVRAPLYVLHVEQCEGGTEVVLSLHH